ncbi:imidazole glycerol phosphate synthase subunit HisH [uncultured Psychroserpens sp.]|uniref:imidazole glycerol phosphate synthase subunit HisH n=1 Tax=uncultured Psychroserpens sp. TaxID=255436 RepID=UPI00261D4614|nr:imidazole glycerol phosphate synthase subunit HisH [uncultured Psychroserpens sp.]
MNVVIVDYGAGNIKSIQFAFKRLGIDAKLSNHVECITKADRVIFPGVGEASSAMAMLEQSGLDTLIPQLKQPVLGICLGMQLMCNASEEGYTDGMGIFDVNVKRFSNDVKVPQMGWNTIDNLKSDLFRNIREHEFMYLIHSFYAEMNDQCIATSTYGMNYASALRKDNFYGVQFHPEKSSLAGEQLLKNFLEL